MGMSSRPAFLSLAATREWGVDTIRLVGRWAWVSPVLVMAAVVRVFGLGLLGPFIDESGHVYLANHLDNYPLYLRAAEGGKVLGFWLYYPIAEWATDPILGARLFTALVGVATTMGVMWTVWLLTGHRGASVIAGFVWALIPYVVFYDRLALHDPLISFFFAWAIGLFVNALRNRSYVRGLIAGVAFGCALITKLSAVLLAAVFLLLALMELTSGRGRQSLRTLLAFAVGAAIPGALVIGFIAPDLLRAVGELRWYQGHFIAPLGSASERWSLIASNTGELIHWFVDYNTSYFGLLSVLLIVVAMVRRGGIAFALAIALCLMLLAQVVLFKTWFPRYVVPYFVPLAILVGVGGSELGSWVLAFLRDERLTLRVTGVALGLSLCAVMGLVLPEWIATDYALLTQPTLANLPPIDQDSYLYGWPSGFGVVETATFLQRMIGPHENALIVEGGWGRHGHWSIPILMHEPGNVQFRSADFSSAASITQAVAVGAGRRTLLLAEPPIVPQPPPGACIAAPVDF